MAGWSSGADPHDKGRADDGAVRRIWRSARGQRGGDSAHSRTQPGGATHYSSSESTTSYQRENTPTANMLTGARADGTVNTMDTNWAHGSNPIMGSEAGGTMGSSVSGGGRVTAPIAGQRDYRRQALTPREVPGPGPLRYLWLMIVTVVCVALAVALHRDPFEPINRLWMVCAGLAVLGLYLRAAGGRTALILGLVVAYASVYVIAHYASGGDIIIADDPISNRFMTWFMPAMGVPAFLIPRAWLTGVKSSGPR